MKSSKNKLINYERKKNYKGKEILTCKPLCLLLPNSIFPELESKIACPALVTALASRLEKAISIDNGIMHMISLAKIPMIILFGPTSSKKFSPKVDNVKILDSNVLYKTNDISKISAEDVFNCS